MNAPNSSPDDSALDEIAANWLFEREEGFAPGRAEAFAKWCESDRRHREAVDRIAATLSLLSEMPAVRVTLEARTTPITADPPPKSVGRLVSFNPWPWAAGLAAALVLGTVIWWRPSETRPTPQTYATTVSEPRRIELSDGSVVDLNSATQLRTTLSDRERRVTLDSGEAHFQVAHNPARPFIVTAKGVSVRAVGTAFDVRLVGEKVDVIVTEGKVQVDRVTVSGGEGSRILPALVAGDRAQVSLQTNSAPDVEHVSPVAIHALLAWQDRMTSFTDVPLSEMVARFNRCNSTQLVIDDRELGTRKIGGVIALNQVDAFVRLLEQDGDIVAERRPDGKIVLHRAR